MVTHWDSTNSGHVPVAVALRERVLDSPSEAVVETGAVFEEDTDVVRVAGEERLRSAELVR